MSNNTGPIAADPFLLSIPARLDGTAFLGIIVERTRQYRVTLRVAIFGRRPERGWFRRVRGQTNRKDGNHLYHSSVCILFAARGQPPTLPRPVTERIDRNLTGR